MEILPAFLSSYTQKQYDFSLRETSYYVFCQGGVYDYYQADES